MRKWYQVFSILKQVVPGSKGPYASDNKSDSSLPSRHATHAQGYINLVTKKGMGRGCETCAGQMPIRPSVKSSPSSLIEWELLSNIGDKPAGVGVKSLEEFSGQGKHALFNDGRVRDEFDITQGHHMLFGLRFSSARV